MEIEKLFENTECEKALVRIAEGESEALSVIHRYMNRQIYAVAYAVLRDFSLSDDVVQETYVKILEKAFTYRKGTNARAWVLSVARNISIDLFRRRKFECHSDEDMQELGGRFDEGSVLSSMAVKHALDALDDLDADTSVLRDFALKLLKREA